MKQEQKTLTVGGLAPKTEQNPDGDISQAFTLISYESREDILSKISTDDGFKELLGDLNYGYGLSQRAKVKAALVKANEGPDKAIDKLAKDLVRAFAGMGITKTIEECTALAKQNLGVNS